MKTEPLTEYEVRTMVAAYEAGEKFVDDLRLGSEFNGAGPAASAAGYTGRGGRRAFILGALDRIETHGVKIWTVVNGAEVTRIERRADV